MTNQPGARRSKIESDFMAAMRGIGLASIKQVLGAEIPSASFMETSKAALASRYATGKMSLGGSQESQAFRGMDVADVGAKARQLHESRPRVAKRLV